MLVAPLRAQSGPLSPADLQFTFAVRLMQEKDAELAAEAFGNFVRDYADDARVGDAHYYLAILKRRQGDRAGAMMELKSANKLKYVTAAAGGVLRGQLMLEDGDATGAVAVLEAVDEKQLSDTPGSVAAWRYLLGAAYRGAGNTDAAAKQFEAAAAQAPAPAPGSKTPGPGNGDSSVREMALVELAKTWVQRKEWEKAMGVLEPVVAPGSAAPGSAAPAPGSLQLAGAVAEQLGRWKQAAGYYRRIVERHQSSAEFHGAAAGWLRAMFNEGDDAGVAAHAVELEKLVNAEARAAVDYWHAAALIRQKKYAEARGICARHSDRQAASGPASDDDLRYLDAVAAFHLDAGKFRGWYDGTDASGFSAAQRDHLLYLRAEAEQDTSRAIGMLGGLIEREDAGYAKAALLLRAKLYERAGRKDQAAEDYARYARRYADDGQAEAAMGYAVDLAMAGGEYERAVEMMRGIAKPQAPGSKAPAPAPGSGSLQLKLAVALIKLGRNDEAGKVLDEVLAATSATDARTRALAMYYKGLLLIPPEVKEGGDITAAVEMMKRAMAGDLPGDQRLEAMAVTARLQRMAGQTEQALKTYQQLRDLDPKSFRGRGFDGATALWVGQGLLDGGDAKAAAGWFEAAGEGAKKEDALWAAAMFGRAQAEQKLGQYDKAVEHYRELLGYSGSYGERGRLGLAQSLAATGQRDAAMEEYNGLLSATASEVAATALTDSALLEAAAADRCERTGDAAGVKEHRKEARRRLSRVVILYNQEELGGLPVRAMVLLGRMEEAEGMTEKARGRYEQAGGGEDMEIAKPQAASDERAWRMIGKAELKRMDGQVGDALFLFGKVVKEDGAGDAGRYAKQRLALLGGKP